MRTLNRVVLLVVFALGAPAVAHAQASIAGTVKDASGAVLPGVTVEASSPALTEKTRSVVTDSTGTYRIIDLRPGTYTVTFALTGFATVKREDIELAGTFTAAVNVEQGWRRGNDYRQRRVADRRRATPPSSGSCRRKSSTHPWPGVTEPAILIPGRPPARASTQTQDEDE